MSGQPVTGGSVNASSNCLDEDNSPGMYLDFFALLFFATCVLIFWLQVICTLNFDAVWDDAYFFVRYADNLMKHGSLSWNPGGEPVYGLTSILYLAVVTPYLAVLGNNPFLVSAVSSVISGFVFLMLIMLLIFRYSGGCRLARRISCIVIFALLAVPSFHLVRHFVSGMDTTFVLAYLTLYLILVKIHSRNPGKVIAATAGVAGGLCYWVRPDIMLFSLLIPLSCIVFEKDSRKKRLSVVMLVTTAGVAALLLLFSRIYFGSFFPLPFYVKSMQHYDQYIYEFYRSKAYSNFFGFIYTYRYFIVLICLCVAALRLKWLKGLPPEERGMIIAAVLFALYYIFVAAHVMAYFARFYYPLLPVIALLTLRSISILIEHMPTRVTETVKKFSRLTFVLALIGLYVLMLPTLGICIQASGNHPGLAGITALDVYHHKWSNYWYRLDRAAELPDDVVIAATEVGMPCALCPGKNIIDIAGLHNPDFSLGKFSFETLFNRYSPDLIYMPHPHYREIMKSFTTSSLFINNYELHSGDELRTLLGIALKKNSPLYSEMRAKLFDN